MGDEILQGGIMSKSNIKLKPCPFCGGEPSFGMSVSGDRHIFVCCPDCLASSNSLAPCGDTEEDAAELWNKRTQPKQAPTPKKYYSDDQITKTCFEACKFMRDIKVGSVWCKTECEHCNGYDDEEQWVKCKLYAITPMEQKP